MGQKQSMPMAMPSTTGGGGLAAAPAVTHCAVAFRSFYSQEPPPTPPQGFLRYNIAWLSELQVDNSTYFSLLSTDLLRFLDARVKSITVPPVAVLKFNMKPEEAIEFLQAEQRIDDAPESIARWLYETPGLSKANLGLYLSSPHLPRAVLRAFLEHFDFNTLRIAKAMEVFFSKIRLPGEAQRVDRLLGSFVHRYMTSNPNSGLADERVAYVLVFGVVMHSFDLQGPSVDHRKRKPEFCAAMAGMNNGANLPIDVVSEIYDGCVEHSCISFVRSPTRDLMLISTLFLVLPVVASAQRQPIHIRDVTQR